jgi:glycosyltransferase involved in cell wall biosynthesis
VRIAASPARDRIRVLGYVPRADLDRLYRAATALAFPSLDEGFGIPVLEAMSAGLPVVTSNRSALPEVAGDAALLVDPADAGALAAALRRAVDNTALREELIRRGRARAAEFTWAGAAQRTLAIYRSLL